MRERAKYLDIAKGIAIICIVLMHFEKGVFPLPMNVFIGSFMISMFYVTTGWLDAQKEKQINLKELLKKRWHQLGIPYLWWTGIILIFDIVLWGFGYYDSYFIGREVYKSIVLRGIGTLWFLPALFGGEIIWHFVRKRKSLSLFFLFIVLTLVYQYVYRDISSTHTDSLGRIIDAPFRTISNVLTAWLGIAAGFGFYRLYSKNLMGLVDNKCSLAAIGLFLCGAAFCAANYFPIPVLWSLFAPLLGPLGIIFVAMAIEKWRVMDYFDYWGKHSLALMVTHYSIIQVICVMINKALFGEFSLSGYNSIVFFIIAMVVEYFIAELLHRKYPCLLGKK